MITCVVVDDEQQNSEILTRLLTKYCPEIQVVGEATTGDAAAELIIKKEPDLVFLDVEMPGMDAFELLAQVKAVPFEYILVTAFDKYAVKAFTHDALHYLLKPVGITDLRLAVQKATARITERRAQASTVSSQLTKIGLPTANGLAFYDIDDIVCCSARQSYTLFDFVSDKGLLVSGSLKEFEEKLPSDIFCRVHHSYLINMNHIREYIKGKGGQVKMVNGKIIDVSARKRDEFLGRLK